MTSVSVRFEEMAASHRFELQRSSTIKETEEMSLVAVVGSRKGFYFKSPNLKKLLLLKKKLYNRGNIEDSYKKKQLTFLHRARSCGKL